jgi:hypothetical protein
MAVVDVLAEANAETPGLQAGDAAQELAPVLPAAGRGDDRHEVALAETAGLAGSVVGSGGHRVTPGSS